MKDDVKQLELFANLPDAEVDWMMANGEIVTLPRGTVFFRQDEPVEAFYVTLVGEMQVARSFNGSLQILGTTPPGVIGGEMSILMDEPSLTHVEAIMDTRLLVFDRETFHQIFAHAPVIGARILRTATQRLSSIGRMLGQREKQAALGRLSAGLAHELNNPASAARRAAQTLRELMPAVQHYTLSLKLFNFTPEQIDALINFQIEVLERRSGGHLSAIERSDCEEILAAWLNEIGFEDGYAVASSFVERGVMRDDIEKLAAQLDPNLLVPVLRWLDSALTANTLMEEIDNSTHRISKLVDAVKSYTYMDQGEFQNVDVHAGLENTLTVLNGKLSNRMIVRSFDHRLPVIVGRGSDLNEVWGNLIENAIDATTPDGCISLITRVENAFVMVEIADNGNGISAEIFDQVFEPFFTTKPLGEGIGLGLDICNRIIRQHQGTIELHSRPGQTRFIVRLPIQQTTY